MPCVNGKNYKNFSIIQIQLTVTSFLTIVQNATNANQSSSTACSTVEEILPVLPIATATMLLALKAANNFICTLSRGAPVQI